MIELNKLPHSTYTVLNRDGVELFARLNGTGERPTAIVAHGLSDVHDSPHMRAVASGLIMAGYDVLTYDASNSWGRSGGSIDKATLGAAYLDLCDIFAWAAQQTWFKGPIVLAGHSLGGAAALRFAADNSLTVARLILVSPVVSGKLLAERLNPIIRTLWWFLGRLPEPGHKGKWYGYNLLHDGLSYDGVAVASKLTMPVTIIAATADTLIPPQHQRMLERAMPPGLCKFCLIDGAGHTFTGHLDDLAEAVTVAASACPN